MVILVSLPHMKAYIIISVSLMDQSAHHMLTGMLLHQIKSSCPIDASLYFCSGFHRLICIMKKFSLFFMHFLYFHIVEISGIAWLSTALRVKSALIQNDMKTFFCFSALQDFGCKFFFYIHLHNINVSSLSFVSSFLHLCFDDL